MKYHCELFIFKVYSMHSSHSSNETKRQLNIYPEWLIWVSVVIMKTADCSMNLKTFDFEIDIISKLKKKIHMLI